MAFLLIGGSITVAVPSAVGASAVQEPTFPPIDDWLTVFDEEFDGTFNGQPIVDTSDTKGASTPDGLDDRLWITNNFSDPEAISVTSGAVGGDPGQPADGYLNLRAFTENGDVFNPDHLGTGANAESAPRSFFNPTYGYAEARVKLAQPVGTSSAFWLYSRDLRGHYAIPLRDPAASGAEVDVFEERGPDRVHHTVHWDGYDDAHRSENSGKIACPDTLCQGNWHTYSVLWDPTGYRFFIDGQETYSVDRGISHRGLHLKIGANVDTSGAEFGPEGDPANPLTLVDYVKVWQPAVSEIPAQTMTRNVPAAVPFYVSSVVSEEPLPGPRVAMVDAVSSDQNVIRDVDLKVSGSGADRTLGIISSYTGGVAGTTNITVRARDDAGNVLGSSTFPVVVDDPAAAVPELGSDMLPDLSPLTDTPEAVEFRTAITEGENPTITVHSSNPYLLPDENLALSGDQRVHGLALTALPTRAGSTDVTVTATDPDDGSATVDTFRVTVGHRALRSGDFETGLPPWTLVGGTTPVLSGEAAHSGAAGMHQDVGAISQTINVEPNTSYTLGGWGRSSAAGGFFDLGVVDTHTYPDWDGDGDPDDFDGAQPATVRFDSTNWERKEVVFTTGNFTRQITIIAGNAFLSDIGFDLDDVSLADAPKISQIPDQSIGHQTCVVPRLYVGRVGNGTDSWSVTAAVTDGDASLIAGLAVESLNQYNPFERAIRITPTPDQNASGVVTVTVTATDIESRSSSDSFEVWVNAGSFRNGSFEHNPLGSSAYPGCAQITQAWSPFVGTEGLAQADLPSYDWRYGFRNKGLVLRRGIAFQSVSGLQPDTEYTVSGWFAPREDPPGNVGIEVNGDALPVDGQPLKVTHAGSGWVYESVTFRTNSDAQPAVNVILFSQDPDPEDCDPQDPDGCTNPGGQFHDITLLLSS